MKHLLQHNVTEVKPTYNPDVEMVDGRIIIRDNFHICLKRYQKLNDFGEDVGKIGGVNQGCEGPRKVWGVKSIRYWN